MWFTTTRPSSEHVFFPATLMVEAFNLPQPEPRRRWLAAACLLLIVLQTSLLANGTQALPAAAKAAAAQPDHTANPVTDQTPAQPQVAAAGTRLVSNCFHCHSNDTATSGRSDSARASGFQAIASKSHRQIYKMLVDMRSGYSSQADNSALLAKHAMPYTDAQLQELSRYLSARDHEGARKAARRRISPWPEAMAADDAQAVFLAPPAAATAAPAPPTRRATPASSTVLHPATP